MKTSLAALFFLSAFAVLAQPKFDEQVIDSRVAIGYGLAIGDVDGDGRQDILLADKKQFVWYRNGDWKRFVMIDNLTKSDNVCIAARDIDGDGKVEVAVGAQWNPGETSDTLASGSVHYLVRPSDPTAMWTAIKLHHEPTIHRMRWIKAGRSYHLVVLPLHGRGNKDGAGRGVRAFAYERPTNLNDRWKLHLIDSTMHLTHNMDIASSGADEILYIGGKEGTKSFQFVKGAWKPADQPWIVREQRFGEIRTAAEPTVVLAGIQPMHGNELTVYLKNGRRVVLTDAFNQGHALAVSDVDNNGLVDIVAGWREPDRDGKVGVRLFVPQDKTYRSWDAHWIDDNGMACEDIQVADLNGDGRPDIIAAGRATNNLKIYWNRK